MTGRVGAAYEAAGPSGVARYDRDGPGLADGPHPRRGRFDDAYREGAAQGYRDAGPGPVARPWPGADSGGPAPPDRAGLGAEPRPPAAPDPGRPGRRAGVARRRPSRRRAGPELKDKS